jgi:hypothetical protein
MLPLSIAYVLDFGSNCTYADPILWIRKERNMGTSTAERIDTEQALEDEREERPPRWELAECTCPDYCERDHERD